MHEQEGLIEVMKLEEIKYLVKRYLGFSVDEYISAHRSTYPQEDISESEMAKKILQMGGYSKRMNNFEDAVLAGAHKLGEDLGIF